MAIKIYTCDFAEQLPSIFETNSAFLRAFGGTIQTIEGAEADDTYLHLKTTDTDVVIQDYSTDANVAFGTGTGNTNRFGERHEVKSEDTEVKFDKPLAIHEGIDRYTVNDIPEQVVAERTALHSVAWAGHYDGIMSEVISEAASATIDGNLDEAGVVAAFAKASKTFTNNRVAKNVTRVAYVTSDVYNILIDSDLAKADKNSSVNIDDQTLYSFKGFLLSEQPDDVFQTDENIYFVADGVGVAGIGIPVVRVMDSEDFNGVVLQGAGKLGKFIPEKNKKAILKAKLVEAI